MSTYEKADRAAYLGLGMMFGAAVGVLAGMLTAPKSGQETRDDIRLRAMEARERAMQKRQEMMEKSKALKEDAKKTAVEAIDKTAVKARTATNKAQHQTAEQVDSM
jgi:gas vesicle protein